MPEQATAAPEEWVGIAYAAARLGYSPVTIWREIQAGNLPAMRVGKDFRLPGQLIEDARQAVMTGGQVVHLREFAREWVARHDGAVA